MNPRCKLPCYMNSSTNKMMQNPSNMKGSNLKMLQIPFKRQLPAPKCYKFHQNAANSMENERFQLQNVARQLKWQLPAPKSCKQQGKRAEKTDPKKHHKTGKT